MVVDEPRPRRDPVSRAMFMGPGSPLSRRPG